MAEDRKLAEAAASQLKLAQAAKELVSAQGVEGTTTQQIIHRAGLSRKTFYKYFHDKYELINWICFREWSECYRSTIMENGWMAFKSILDFLESNKPFYAAALRYTGQNSFGSYLVECFYAIIGVYFSGKFLEAGISARWTERIIRMMADDVREAAVNWLEVGSDVSTEEFFEVTLKSAEVFVSFLGTKQIDNGEYIRERLLYYPLSDEERKRLDENLNSISR